MRTHPEPISPDFHCALLWLRSMEIVVGRMPLARFVLDINVEMTDMSDLFARYKSPWRA